MGVPYEEVEVHVVLQRTQTVQFTDIVRVSHENEKERARIACDLVRESWESIDEAMWEQHPPHITQAWNTVGTPSIVVIDA
jgi:hypothetical protein